MRKIFSGFLMLVSSAVLLESCKKGEILQDVDALGQGSYVTLSKTINLIVDAGNLSSSKVSIEAKAYGSEQTKLTLYVTPGTRTADKTKWKKLKEVNNSNNGTYLLEVSGSEIAAAVAPTAVAPGQVYTIYNQITTKDGRTFDLANTNPEFAGLSNYNMALTWQATVVCPFNPTGFPGQFLVLEDQWGDYSTGEEVTVNSATANSLMLTAYPSAAYGSVNRKAIKVDIDPATGTAKVTNQVYGDYPQFGIINTTVNTQGTNNYVFSCVGTITLNLNHFGASGGGNQGTYLLRLKKK